MNAAPSRAFFFSFVIINLYFYMNQNETIAVTVTLVVVIGAIYFSAFNVQSSLPPSVLAQQAFAQGLKDATIVVPGVHTEVSLEGGRGVFESSSKPLEQSSVVLGNFIVEHGEDILSSFSVTSSKGRITQYLGIFEERDEKFLHRWSLPLGEGVSITGVRVENGPRAGGEYTVYVDLTEVIQGKVVETEIEAVVKDKKFITTK